MTSAEKYNWIQENKDRLSNQQMATSLGISKASVDYYRNRYAGVNKDPKDRKPKKRYEFALSEKRVRSEKDFSTSGFFDPEKWGRCLPV